MRTSDGWDLIKKSFESNTLHLIGLLSDGGVHSRYDQLVSILKFAVEDGAKKIRIHVLTDGRDVADGTSVGFVESLVKDLSELVSMPALLPVVEGCTLRWTAMR